MNISGDSLKEDTTCTNGTPTVAKQIVQETDNLVVPVQLGHENDEVSSECDRQVSVVSPGRPSNPVVVLINDDQDGGVEDRENSQTASLPPQRSPDDDDEASDSVNDQAVSTETSFSNQGSFARRRKRRRRAALVADDARDRPLLPPNQYETLLRRRAICKPENENESKVETTSSSSVRSLIAPSRCNVLKDASDDNDDAIEGYDEQCGDISVGMQLNIIGGKVIVQRVNTLSDGRASPAQLTGLIQRGDVLLSIDGVSLVNLPLDQLLAGLKPLSAPHHGNYYKRSVHLRFAAGEGLKLLEKSEAIKKPSADPTFALSQYVTFVDQLSGVPMYEPEIPKYDESEKEPPVVATAVETAEPSSNIQQGMSMDRIISVDVADFRKLEQFKYASEFFMWNEDFSGILSASAMLLPHEYADGQMPMTFSEMMENGERAMVGAKALFHNMEDVDKGADTRSFQKWNSTLSLRSRASARRRYVMKNVIAHEETLVEEEEELSDLGSVGSSTSGDAEEPSGDELLLQLAAHDEIWRHNVVDVLQTSYQEIKDAEQKEQQSAAMPENDQTEGDEAHKSLESLLFGDQVSKMLTTKKKSHALPPEEVTSVLFDLMTSLTVTPDEISLNGGSQHVRPMSNLAPFRERHSNDNVDVKYAAQFLISEALPIWLKSFRPLPWEQRRILWPTNKMASGSMSLASASHIIPDDDLTVESESTGFTAKGSRHHFKDLRQQIEDLELNEETRAETCILATFYFTQELLPAIGSSGADRSDIVTRIDEAVKFVQVYGAYLRLDSSFVSAAMIKADDVIDELLSLSKHDPRHREAKKELSKASSFLLYEPTMLSAIVARLKGIQQEPKSDRRGDMMNVCVLAYPDLRPWQVRQACLGSTAEGASADLEFHEMYYEYLSLLLHPWDGHDAARHDVGLVTEWCQLSLQILPSSDDEEEPSRQARETERRNNFYRVASRSSSDYRFYGRDLFSLMNMSIEANESDLALDLVGEMLDSPKYRDDKTVLSSTLDILRSMAKDALFSENSPSGEINDIVMRKVVNLFEKMATNKSAACRESIDVSVEFHSLLKLCQTADHIPSDTELSFVKLLAHHGSPTFVLRTLAMWAPDYPQARHLLPLLHVVLQRGTNDGIKQEISGSLLRVRYARAQSQGKQGQVVDSSTGDSPSAIESNVWRRMFDGSVTIAK